MHPSDKVSSPTVRRYQYLVNYLINSRPELFSLIKCLYNFFKLTLLYTNALSQRFNLTRLYFHFYKAQTGNKIQLNIINSNSERMNLVSTKGKFLLAIY